MSEGRSDGQAFVPPETMADVAAMFDRLDAVERSIPWQRWTPEGYVDCDPPEVYE